MKEIPLSQGKVALVDDKDYDRLVAMGKWFYNSNGYAVVNKKINGKQGQIYMHREVMGLKRGDKLQVDHKFGVRLDNRKENLRVCKVSENLLNKTKRPECKTSKYKGVGVCKRTGKYISKVIYKGRYVFQGRTVFEETAAALYNHFARIYHRDFAYLNDINELNIDFEDFFNAIDVFYNSFSSNYRGVTFLKTSKKYVAQIRVNRKIHHIGVYSDEVDAAKAYNIAAIQHRGELARLNQIPA